MSNKWFWVLLLLFLVGGFSAGLLNRRYKVIVDQTPADPTSSTQGFGSVVVTYSNPPSDEKEILRSAVLNKLIVEDFNFDVVEVKGEKKSLLNLIVSLDYQGETKRLTIPVVDTIVFQKATPRGFEDQGDISVTSLNLEKGRMVNIGFSYIPKGNLFGKDELVDFCELLDFRLCLKYIDLGFGNEEIDFNEYLKNLFANKDTATLDFKVVFPNLLSLLGE